MRLSVPVGAARGSVQSSRACVRCRPGIHCLRPAHRTRTRVTLHERRSSTHDHVSQREANSGRPCMTLAMSWDELPRRGDARGSARQRRGRYLSSAASRLQAPGCSCRVGDPVLTDPVNVFRHQFPSCRRRIGVQVHYAESAMQRLETSASSDRGIAHARKADTSLLGLRTEHFRTGMRAPCGSLPRLWAGRGRASCCRRSPRRPASGQGTEISI